ncbi:MAG TPA: BON domain-containing protein [Opitutaceae bacterium]|nr:BON domain-containing protein [Opitutaceae bacterium]
MKITPLFVALLLGASTSTLVISGCAGTSTRESTGEYIDNTALTARVKAAFASDEVVKARDVSVESFRGTVQLSGFVETSGQKERAESIAKSIQGVQAVKNNIIVKAQ